MTSATLAQEARAHRLRRSLAVCLTIFLTVLAIVATPAIARAATPGIEIDMLHDGAVLEDGAVVSEGDDILVRVRYDTTQGIDGQEVTLTLPSTVTAPSVPSGNDAVESIVDNGDGTITIRFFDPIPASAGDQGALALKLKVGQVDGDEDVPLEWKIGDDTSTLHIVVKNHEEPPTSVTDRYAKKVNPTNLNSYVRTSGSPDYEFIGLDESIEDATLTYTLELDSAEARDGYSIEDTLPAGLDYVADSFSGRLTTFDPEETADFPFSPTVTDGSFSAEVSVPENSKLSLAYEVVVTDRAALEDLLRAQYEGRDDTPGNYQINLTNTASFGDDTEKTATVGIVGNIPGVGVGQAFAKDGEWTRLEVDADDDGTLSPPAEMTYSLKADLTKWDGRNANFTLQRNVVISDTLVDQASWMTGEADFLTADGIDLAEAADCPSEADFAADAYVGQWCVDGQTLLVNVGKSKTTNATLHAKAQLNTVAGLAKGGDTTIDGATSYLWPNTARFFYRNGAPFTDGHDAHPVVLPSDRDDGLHDSGTFTKTGPESDIRVDRGDTAEVPYRFRVDTSNPRVDPTTSRIVDEVDEEIFDISDPATIPVSGSYGDTPLGAEHFALSLDDENKLVIELSAAGKTLVKGLPAGQVWTIDIVLTTVAFDDVQKETLEIYNRAVLQGSDGEPQYWDDDGTEATSYGDEAEVRKRVYDAAAGQWTDALQARIDDGAFVDDVFYYRVEFIPRGSYGSAFPVQIFSVNDILPDAVDFVGFVGAGDDGAPIADPVSLDSVELNGNVVASYADGVVRLEQKPGTDLDPDDGAISAYFAVKAEDASDAIVNKIGNTSATIEPVGDPSVDIEKWNDEGEAPEYDDSGALLNDGYDGDFDEAPGKALAAGDPLPIAFTVSNDGREDLVDVTVSDSLTDGAGEIGDLVCTFPDGSTGVRWDGPFRVGTQFDCSGTLPALDGGDVHSDTAKVTGTGILTGEVVEDEDDWNGHVPQPSVDIEKWNDEGEAPEYDDSGALLNDGYDGDFDTAPGKQMVAGEEQEIRFTVSNDGDEPLVSVVVSDELIDGKGEIRDLVCTFPDGSTGTEWDGPLAIGEQFDCTGVLPALKAGETHADTAKVTATGLFSGIGVDDADDWHGSVPEAPATVPDGDDGDGNGDGGDGDGGDVGDVVDAPADEATATDDGLAVTGGGVATAAIVAAILLLLTGGGIVISARRSRSNADG